MYAVITGASSGIGKELAFLLAKKDYNLVLVARRLDRLNSLKEQINQEYNVNVIVKQFDLSKAENCYQLHQETEKLDVELFVNNAGFGQVGFFSENELDGEISMLNLNILSLHILTKLYSNSMKKGIILNVGSMAAFLPTPLLATYAATKSYVVNFSRAVNYELKMQKKSLRIKTLCPGPVDTEFNEVAHANGLAIKGITARQCALTTVNHLYKKKDIIIPSFKMKATHFFLRFVPTSIVMKISYYFQSKKR